MNKIIAIVLLLVGAGLLWHGANVRDSMKGKVQEAGADIQKAVSGDTEVTDATWYLLGGGVLLAAGLVGLLRAGAKG